MLLKFRITKCNSRSKSAFPRRQSVLNCLSLYHSDFVMSLITYLVYLDDINNALHNFKEHLRNIKALGYKRIVNTKFNPSEYNLFPHELCYLGYIVSAEGVRSDPDKISTIQN